MKKCVLIIPYFGKFPNYFQLFLNSCANNNYFDFLIFSDIKDIYYSYSENVRFYYMEFHELQDKIKKINYNFALSFPKKLCDFRPMYGYIFQEYISQYFYWGHCDVDLIFGDLDNLVFPILETKKYDKIFNHGHLTLYKNNDKVNKLFYKEIEYKRQDSVFFKHEMCKFDEENSNSITRYFLQEGLSIYTRQLEADISTKYSRLFLDKYDFYTNSYHVVKQDNLFVYSNGKILNYYISKKKLVVDEYAYIHLQKRNMGVFIQDENNYIIASNRFYSIKINTNELTIDDFVLVRKHFVNLHFIKIRYANFLIKLKKIFFD